MPGDSQAKNDTLTSINLLHQNKAILTTPTKRDWPPILPNRPKNETQINHIVKALQDRPLNPQQPSTQHTNTPLLQTKPSHTQIDPTPHSKPSPTTPPKRILQQPTMDLSDEEFVEKFTAMTSGYHKPIEVPTQVITQTDWNRCTMVRVVTDKSIYLSQFSQLMMRVWAVNPHTEMSVLDKNIFLVQFVTEGELTRVLNKGIWTYRGDAVVIWRVLSQADLDNPQVLQMEVVTQWHRIPRQAITHEGILMLSQKIGEAMAEVEEVFSGDNFFYRLKLLIPIDKPLKDKLQITHPTLGSVNIYLVYEKLNNLCLFCVHMGHLESECPDKLRMARLCMDQRFRDRLDKDTATKPKIGPWINNSAVVPIREQDTESPTQQQPNPPAPIPHIPRPRMNLVPAVNPTAQLSTKPNLA